MKFKYKLSIIIPCYNCEKTISKTLDSIVNNDLKKEEYQVIIVNDKCTDNSMNIIKQYEDKINITYCETTREVHCPGNSRQAGIPYIQGEWTTFIDNDDIFKPNIFQKVFNSIKKNDVHCVLVTKMERVYNNSIDIITAKDNITWMHGKFYNTKKIFYNFKISFKEDMVGEEDLYFNSLVRVNYYLENDENFYYFDDNLITYEWINYENSFSNITANKWNYTDEHLKEYTQSTIDTFLTYYSDNLEEKVKQDFNSIILTSLLYTYFYYQDSVLRVGTTKAFKNIIYIYELKEKIKEKLKCNENDIIQFIYSHPELYTKLRNQTCNSQGDFIEIQSFRDFIINL